MFGIDAGVANAGTLGHAMLFRNWDKQDRNEQRAYDRDRFVRLAQDAKRGGIHPLYAMGAGTTSPALQKTQAPRGAKSDIGASIRAMGQNKTQALQNDLLEEQIKAQQLENTLTVNEIQNMPGQTGKSVNKNPKTDSVDVTKDYIIGGHKVQKNQDWADSEVIEQRLGDAISWAYGAGVLGADLYTAIKNKFGAPDSDIKKIMSEVKKLRQKYAPKKSNNPSFPNQGKGKFYR